MYRRCRGSRDRIGRLTSQQRRAGTARPFPSLSVGADWNRWNPCLANLLDLRFRPVVVAFANAGWFVGGMVLIWLISNLVGSLSLREQSEKSAQERLIGKIAEQEATKRFERWKVWDYIRTHLTRMAMAAFVIWFLVLYRRGSK